MKVGTVALMNWDGAFHKMIRFYNRKVYGQSGWSHAGIITEDKGENVLIHEAIGYLNGGGGFLSSEYPKWWVENKIKEGKMKLLYPKKKIENVFTCAQKYEGTKYAWKDIIAIGAILIFGKKAVTNSTGAQALICSEAVSRVLYDASSKQINFEEEFKKPYDQITPTDLSISNQLK